MAAASPGSSGELESWAGDPRAVRVGELLNEFLDLRSSGNPITPDVFLARHPEYAGDLSRHFEGLGLLDRIAGATPPPQADDSATEAAPHPVHRNTPGRSHAQHPVPLPEIDGYDLLREIGRGGMGIVYKAMQKSTRRVVAMKLLLEGPYASESARKRFEREIALAAQLRHPNIVPIYDSGATGGRMFYAMEYVHGLPLGQHVKDNKPSLRERLAMFVHIGQAVGHAHQRGVIHRDLKPSNILVDGDGHPHVHDFGLAKSGSVQDVTLSITAQLVGTPAYMAPEQVVGDPGAVDTRTDVYALGVMLYEMLTGALPYEVKGGIAQIMQNISHADPDSPRGHNPQVDDEIETILSKALAKRKEERYQSVAEFTADVERYLAGDPIQAKPATPIYLLRKMIGRHRHQVAIGSLVVILIAAGFALKRVWSEKTQVKSEVADLRNKTEELKSTAEDLKSARYADEQLSAAKVQSFFEALHRAGPEAEQKVMQELGNLYQSASKEPSVGAAAMSLLLQKAAGLDLPIASQPASRNATSQPIPDIAAPTTSQPGKKNGDAATDATGAARRARGNHFARPRLPILARS